MIPLSSKREADAFLAKTKPELGKRNSGDTDGSTDVSDEETIVDEELQDELQDVRPSGEGSTRGHHNRTLSSIGEDVIGKKGVYGRFAEKWFSKRGWTEDRRRAEGLSPDEGEERAPQPDAGHASPSTEGVDIRKPENKPAPNTGKGVEASVDTALVGDGEQKVEEAVEAVKEDVTHNLTPKLLHTTRLLLGESRSFFFSYDWDITRSWSTQHHSQSSSLPLFKLVDPLVSFPLPRCLPLVGILYKMQDYFSLPYFQ